MTYNYETLSPERFQHFCQSLLAATFPNIQCLPVAQPDGGRDAFLLVGGDGSVSQKIIFQVKFVRSPEEHKEERKFLDQICASEAAKVNKLVSDGANAYYLLTNVPGTSHYQAGSIDRVNDVLSAALNLPAYCWWRDDLDRRVDLHSDLKWSFPEIIRGTDVLQALLEGKLGENAEKRSNAVRSYLAAQYKDDEEVRFKQVELQNKLLELFVDVPLRIIRHGPEDKDFELFHSYDLFEDGADVVYHQTRSFPEAVATLVKPIVRQRFPKAVIEGAPGQGKSTITQFLCQINRMVLLGKSDDIDRLPPAYRNLDVQFPIRIDLRDYSAWVNRQDPFSPGQTLPSGPEYNPALESFVAFQIGHYSGGHTFSVSDFTIFAKASRLLIALDGFDEIADVKTRERVVSEISKAAARISAQSKSVQFIVTSRPAVFANSPGFSEKEWRHFELEAMTSTQIELYAKKWMNARHLTEKERVDFSNVLVQKMAQPHLRDLARNPMQLTILLALVHTRGLSLPDKRTALYDQYMELFFSREAEKSSIVREHRELLVDLHRYIAWLLHVEAEGGRGRGSIEEARLKTVLRSYLNQEGHPSELVDELFTGMVERVVALVSRVQGTFEFEVQPLREYFAARYLYETAPYSPAGHEKRGTKPDRFDAIARNFYWLNVTRFYGGCFSKGELASLLASLETLANDPDYSNLSHPRSLAWMLLSDWVFSQQPMLVRKVLEFITQKEGFRFLLSLIYRDRTTFSLALPERCGQGDLVRSCQQQYAVATKQDSQYALATALTVNMDQAKIMNYWLSLKPVSGASLEQWFTQGVSLNIYKTIDSSVAVQLCREFGMEVISRFFGVFRYDVCCADAKVFEDALRLVLDGRNFVHRYIADDERQDLPVFAAILDGLTPYTYYSAFHESSPGPLRQLLGRRYASPGGVHISLMQLPPNLPENIKRACQEFADLFSRLSKETTKTWTSKRELWSELVETARSLWGDQRTIIELAVMSAGVRTGPAPPANVNIFQKDIPLCERARFARLKSGAPDWWRKQVIAAQSSHEKLFLLMLMMTWITPKTILKIAVEISSFLDSIERDDWKRAVTMSNYIRMFTANSKKYALALTNKDMRDLGKTSHRVQAAIAMKVEDNIAAKIFSSCLGNYSGDDEAIIGFCADTAFSFALNGSASWEAFLHTAKHAHLHNEPVSVPELRPRSKNASMPLKVAKTICAAPVDFPLNVVGAAESVIQGEIGSTVSKVGAVAEEENWFV